MEDIQEAIEDGKRQVIDYIECNFWSNNQIIITKEEWKHMKYELEM